MTTRQMIQRFVQPISYAPKSYFFSVFCEVRDVFQSIFTIQLGVNIIQAIEQKNTEMMYYQARLLGSVFFVSLFISIGREISLEHTRNMIEYGIKKTYLGKFLHLNHTEVESLGTGKMQNIIMQGSYARQNILTGSGLSIILEAFGILYAFLLIWYKSSSIQDFLIFTGIAVLSFVFIIIGLQKLNSTRKQSKEINLELSRQEIKIIMSKFEVLQSNKFENEMNHQLTLVKENIRIRQRGNFIKSLRQAGSVGLIKGFQLYIYLGIGLSVITGTFTIAYILLLLQLLDTISTYIRQLRKNFKNFYREKTNVEKLRETFDTIPTIDHSSGTQFHSQLEGINFENVTFGYSSTANNILNTLSLTIHGKQKIALVGPSGGGKSTLIKLIAGYLQPDSGSIIVDGQDLKDVSLLSYYKHIGYLTQEPSVFDGTIRENLEYGIQDYGRLPQKISEDGVDHNLQISSDLSSVIPLAKCERIYDLPHGLDTEIGERGVRLSGGQKQRLAIAKIMLKNPNIILLDEPTSALDSANEQAVTEALNNLFKNKTVIIIAHRLQTVKNADDIIYIADGKVVERGTHEELLALGGEYYTMVELQSGF